MRAAGALLGPVQQEPAASKLVDLSQALLLRYVSPGETLDSMLAMSVDEALESYTAFSGVTGGLYAKAMTDTVDKYPDGTHLGAVAVVGSLMQSPAWRWWAPGSEYQQEGDPPGIMGPVDNDPILQTSQQLPNATRANTVLNAILAKDPMHLGGNHYLIHNIEMGPSPQWALGVADRIFEADPFDGHIPHMASHIYSRLGFHERVSYMNRISNKVPRHARASSSPPPPLLSALPCRTLLSPPASNFSPA